MSISQLHLGLRLWMSGAVYHSTFMEMSEEDTLLDLFVKLLVSHNNIFNSELIYLWGARRHSG